MKEPLSFIPSQCKEGAIWGSSFSVPQLARPQGPGPLVMPRVVSSGLPPRATAPNVSLSTESKTQEQNSWPEYLRKQPAEEPSSSYRTA